MTAMKRKVFEPFTVRRHIDLIKKINDLIVDIRLYHIMVPKNDLETIQHENILRSGIHHRPDLSTVLMLLADAKSRLAAPQNAWLKNLVSKGMLTIILHSYLDEPGLTENTKDAIQTILATDESLEKPDWQYMAVYLSNLRDELNKDCESPITKKTCQ
jgi:hypothetical protein